MLQSTLVAGVEGLDKEVVQSTLRLAASLQCDVEALLRPAGLLVVRLLESAARSRLQPMSRLSEAGERSRVLPWDRRR